MSFCLKYEFSQVNALKRVERTNYYGDLRLRKRVKTIVGDPTLMTPGVSNITHSTEYDLFAFIEDLDGAVRAVQSCIKS